MRQAFSTASHPSATFTPFAVCGILLSAAAVLLWPRGPLSELTLRNGTIVGIAAALTTLLFVLSRFARRLLQRGRKTSFHEDRFTAAADSSLDAVFLLDAVRNEAGDIDDFIFTYLNRNAQTLLKLTPEAAVGARLCELLPGFRDEAFLEQYKRVVRSGKPSDNEFAVSNPDIDARWLRCSVVPCGRTGLAVTASNLTERKEFERKIYQSSQHDTLTALPNRALLDDRIQQAIERAKRSRLGTALLILDLDGFSDINETHGHAAGDHVLKTVAARLRSAVRTTDSVFRLGNDQFVVLFADLPAQGIVTDFTRKLLASLLPPIPWRHVNLRVNASIGAAMYPKDGTTPESLLVQADISMYRMKRMHADRNQRMVSPSITKGAYFPLVL